MAVRFRTKCVKVVHAKRRKQTRSIAGIPCCSATLSEHPACYVSFPTGSFQPEHFPVQPRFLRFSCAIGYQYWAQQNAYSGLEEYAEVDDNSNLALSDLKVDWDGLRAINPDVVAWVYVPGTPINYPVVQGSDNQEYLHKAFDGSTGWLASAGTIFLDASNTSDLSDQNNALYGHHMNDGSMFASLADFEDQDTFDSHRDIYVLTPQGNYRLKTFALVKTTGSDAIVQTSFANDASYQAYVQDKLNRSVVSQKGDTLTAADIKQSVLFSTCEYSQNDGRAVLFAAVVETTAANDPYLSSSTSGTTGLSSSQDAVMDRKYEEAA